MERLNQLKDKDDQWFIHFEVDKHTHQFKHLFFMSPYMGKIAQRYPNVIINDIAMLRNQYGCPLNIFVVIDQFFVTRNIAYALHTSETTEEHTWVLNCLFENLPPCHERVFFSDADLGLDAAVSRRPHSEIAFHGCCLNHLDGNVVKKLAPILGPLLQSFQEAFWSVYYAISPEALEIAWNDLLTRYPATWEYLDRELWPDRE
jgi:hypothetical protein